MFNIDIQYTWLLLFLPLVVAAFDWFLLTKRPDVAALTSTFSCLATFVLSLGLLDRTGSDSFSWLPISDIFSVDLGFVLDPLSSRMMLVVTGIGLLDVELRDPALPIPLFRTESKENFERLLHQDTRNGRITSYLPADMSRVNDDFREVLTSHLMTERDKGYISGWLRSGENNRGIAQLLSPCFR